MGLRVWGFQVFQVLLGLLVKGLRLGFRGFEVFRALGLGLLDRVLEGAGDLVSW